ncbi:MAG: hypothetical protein QM831_28610 [Kofleriaceae bacterium]
MKHIVLIMIAAAIAHADGVRHVAPADAIAGTSLELVAEASPTIPALHAHVRTSGTQEFHDIELVRRDDAKWIATVPADAVATPGLEYYLTAGDAAVFATPDWPHTVEVRKSDDDDRMSRDVTRSHARRSRIHVSGDWVDFGKPNDSYYRVDADFTYRLWAYPLEELRVGYSRLLGTTEAMDGTSSDAGFKVAGWFELGLAPIEGVRVDGRMMVMATKSGFGIGGRGELRFGDRDGSHIAIGAEAMQDVGASGFFRLGWGTVAAFPMSATVEVTNLPATTNDVGVRLYYDVAHEIATGFRLGLRVGYAAREAQVAGITGGLAATMDF